MSDARSDTVILLRELADTRREYIEYDGDFGSHRIQAVYEKQRQELLRQPDAERVLIGALGGASRDQQVVAFELLRKLGVAPPAPALANCLRALEPDVRIAALDAVSGTTPASVVPIVVERAGDPDEWVRRAALTALHRIDRAAASALLTSASADPSEPVRERAAELLVGDLRDGPVGREALAPFCRDARAGDRPVVALLTGEIVGRSEEASAAVNKWRDAPLGEGLVPLLARLEDASAQVARKAAWELGRRGDAAAAPPLLAFVARGLEEAERCTASWGPASAPASSAGSCSAPAPPAVEGARAEVVGTISAGSPVEEAAFSSRSEACWPSRASGSASKSRSITAFTRRPAGRRLPLSMARPPIQRDESARDRVPQSTDEVTK